MVFPFFWCPFPLAKHYRFNESIFIPLSIGPAWNSFCTDFHSVKGIKAVNKHGLTGVTAGAPRGIQVDISYVKNWCS